MIAYYVRYDEHQDQWCIIYFVDNDRRIHSTYNTFACASDHCRKLNQFCFAN